MIYNVCMVSITCTYIFIPNSNKPSLCTYKISYDYNFILFIVLICTVSTHV